MPIDFALAMHPWTYIAQYQPDGSWLEEFVEKPHRTPAEEAAMDPAERAALVGSRNSFPELPLINYTTQYGMGCFEGLKAYPQADGTLKVFRPDENGRRMASSMSGLAMPSYPADRFASAVIEIVRKNHE